MLFFSRRATPKFFHRSLALIFSNQGGEAATVQAVTLDRGSSARSADLSFTTTGSQKWRDEKERCFWLSAFIALLGVDLRDVILQ